MRKQYLKRGFIFILTLFLLGVAAMGTFGHLGQQVEAAATNIVGLQMIDWSDCSYSGLGTARYASDVATWMPWTGDSDNYDPDCVRLYLGNTVPKDLDIRIGIHARDINTPCGFLWLFKCGDGGGTIVYGPWASESPNSWTAWAGDADMFDADQWRLIVDTRPRYGFTVSDFRLGIQVGDVGDIWSGGGGCTQQIGTTRYTASSSVSTGWTSWAADNYDNGDYNCTRINLVSTSTMNSPEAALTGTSTAPFGNSVNVPWTVNYISSCTLTGRNGAGTIVDPAYTITSNGSGSKTSIAITAPVTYTLSCTGTKTGSTVTATKTISTITEPATLAFSMSPTSGIAAGGTSVASITATNASSCTLVGKNLSGGVVDSGYTFTPPPPSAVVTGGTVGPVYITSTAQTTWTVPSDWGSTNTVHVIGAGGGNSGRLGGGGGGYSRQTNISLTPGQTITVRVGASAAGATGGDTWFNGSTCAGSSVCAKGGTAGGAGGAAGSGVGTLRYSGGTRGGATGLGSSGGGGAGGPNGNGANGGGTSRDEGAGGGGNGGGGAGGTANSVGGCWAGCGGPGGSRYGGGGGGTYGNKGAGGAGSTGGGGGGGDDDVTYPNGGAGGHGTDINGSVGSGGGGGGGGQDNSGNYGGAGGLYGGGGGGSSAGGANSSGGRGIIVIYYTSATIAKNTDVQTSTHTVNQTTDYTVDCTGLDGVHVVKTVRVTLSSCLLDGVTINNGGSSNFYSESVAPAGHTCSEYGPSVRGCTDGALTGNTSYVYASCLDQSSITIKANDISTATSVRKGSTVALSWDGGNATSCTVTGTDGFSSDEITATRSVTINQKTIYTAVCTLGASSKRASVTVNILPTIIEN